MQIEFEMDGGLAYMPGLAKPVTIEVDQLPEAEARDPRPGRGRALLRTPPADRSPAGPGC